MRVNYVCDNCGKQFIGHKRKGRWQFCNRDCLNAARCSGGAIALSRQAEQFTRVCALPECGKTFTYTRKHKKKQYCDRQCANLARRAGGPIAQKVDETTFQHHGVKRFFSDKDGMRAAMQATHGVDNVSQIPGLRKESWKKAHATKKRNGTYKASKIEHALHEALRNEGCTVKIQEVIFGRPIDFLIEDDMFIYVQLDGLYWHGLDRPLEEIRASSSPRDHSILERWHSDREQDKQFADHGLRLVRVTDQEVREWLKQKRTLLPLIKARALQQMKSTI